MAVILLPIIKIQILKTIFLQNSLLPPVPLWNLSKRKLLLPRSQINLFLLLIPIHFLIKKWHGGLNEKKTDEALRIRTCENFTTRETTSFLTYKGAKLDTVSTTRKELETRIEDADIAREILISLGYKKLYPVTKLRQYYHKGRMTACVDQVESLGSFLELEILVDSPEQKESALQSIEALLLDMGSSLKETTRKSYLSMLLSKGSPD